MYYHTPNKKLRCCCDSRSCCIWRTYGRARTNRRLE